MLLKDTFNNIHNTNAIDSVNFIESTEDSINDAASAMDNGDLDSDMLQTTFCADGVRDCIPVYLHKDLSERAMKLLYDNGYKLAIAESCTGGLLSYHFTALGGASHIIDGAMISYANAIKSKWLKVSKKALRDNGAVSEIVVRQMCAGILQAAQADIAMATSGIAGPSGGSTQKPVGYVFIGVQKRGQEARVIAYHFKGDRHAVQSQSCAAALEMLIALLA